MVRFLLILVFTVFFIMYIYHALALIRPGWSLNPLRRKGAPKGPPTMFQVRELLVRQEKEKAIQLYCQIFNVGKKEAKKAVDELERSIPKKH